MNWKDSLIPGFIGKAMRDSGADELKNSEIKMEPPLPLTTDDLLNTNIKIARSKSVDNLEIDSVAPEHSKHELPYKNNINNMSESKITAKVIAGKNQSSLEENLNNFFTEFPDIEIVRTDFSSTAIGLYYVVVFKTPMTRV